MVGGGRSHIKFGILWLRSKLGSGNTEAIGNEPVYSVYSRGKARCLVEEDKML